MYRKNHVTSVMILCKIQTIKILDIYYPPRYNLKKEASNNLFQSPREKFVIDGDYNVKPHILEF